MFGSEQQLLYSIIRVVTVYVHCSSNYTWVLAKIQEHHQNRT